MLANLNGRAEFTENDSSGGKVLSGPGGQRATGGQSARFGNNVNSQRGGSVPVVPPVQRLRTGSFSFY